MLWPWRRKSRRRMARVVLDGPINGATRQRVLKALREVEEREFPALLLRIDSPGGTVGDSQEIHAALLRLRKRLPCGGQFRQYLSLRGCTSELLLKKSSRTQERLPARLG